jgi:hypothetical protein
MRDISVLVQVWAGQRPVAIDSGANAVAVMASNPVSKAVGRADG